MDTHVPKLVPLLAGITGLILMGLNILGEFHGMRVAEAIPEEELRFENDISMSSEAALAALRRKANESDREFAVRANGIIQNSMAHIKRWHGHDPDTWNQRVPFTENPYLHVVGRFSGLPQFERYHFANYRKSLERGVGVCGDHTLILAQVLDKEGIENSLLSFPAGHVLAEVKFDDGSLLLDPDFGVVVDANANSFVETPSTITNAYRAAGYSENEIDALNRTFKQGYVGFESAYSFMRLRWWFEHISYVLKWVLPICLLISSALILKRRARMSKQETIFRTTA